MQVGGFPLALRILPGDRYAVVTDGGSGDEALRIVDLLGDPKKAVISTYDYPLGASNPHSPALFLGMALTQDGKRLYVSNGGYDPVADQVPLGQHYNTIDVFDLVGSPPKLVRNEPAMLKLRFNASASTGTARLPAGMTLSSNEKLLYVATQVDSTLAILDLAPQVGDTGYGAEIGRAAIPGTMPYDVAVDETSQTAFVSLWGGQTVGQSKYLDGVITVNVADPHAPVASPVPISTGKSAEAVLLVGGKLFVANADADTVSVIDVASRAVKQISLASGPLLGNSPNHLAVDTVGAGRLYVANANANAVDVFDLSSSIKLGSIPTAWYPTAVAVRSDGSLVIAAAKGLGLGPTDHQPGINDYMPGTLELVPRPSDMELALGAQKVADNLARPRSYQMTLNCPAGSEPRFPLPSKPGEPTPIQHVFLIVRENKTYDVLLGDLSSGNAAPSLTLFGRTITPNLHALVDRFGNLDNYYANSEASLQGHEWTTASFSNDYSEKAWSTTWGRRYRSISAFGAGSLEHLARPASDTIWSHLDHAQIAYHNYGEAANTGGALHIVDGSFPGIFFDLTRTDVEKIQYINDQLQDPTFALEPFSYIGLPNDHTVGTTPGRLTPQSMIADNDEATGRLIDVLSHSRFWDKSIVFIIEDDPSDGADHVDGHRSICVAISPWVKRGFTSSVHYDIPALWRTINLLLGVGPMNGYDGNAAAMVDLFADHPDLTPYNYIPRQVPEALNPSGAPLWQDSEAIDFSRPDGAPLGRILWRAVAGMEPPWGPRPSPRPASLRAHEMDDDD